MEQRFAAAVILAAALALSGCSAAGVAASAVGVGVSVGTSVASTGVHIGVGATVRAADLIVPDRAVCEPAEEYPEEIEGEDCAED